MLFHKEPEFVRVGDRFLLRGHCLFEVVAIVPNEGQCREMPLGSPLVGCLGHNGSTCLTNEPVMLSVCRERGAIWMRDGEELEIPEMEVDNG